VTRRPRSPPCWARRFRRYRGRWPPTAADKGTGSGGRTSVPASRPGIPRRRSSPARCWLPRSVPGCTSGDYRSGSYGGCAASWPAACAPAGLGAARAAVMAGRIYQGHGDDRRSSCRGPARRPWTAPSPGTRAYLLPGGVNPPSGVRRFGRRSMTRPAPARERSGTTRGSSHHRLFPVY
jgi:hypothetical protein